MKKQEIIIVGAGPVGCYVGQLLKQQGFVPKLIEEHKEIGRPIHCAGLVGSKVFASPQIALQRECILNTINGARFHFGRDSFTIKRKQVAYVIDRERFDKELGEGLDVRFETKFLGVEKNNGHYIVETDKGEIEADIIVGADGARSAVREFVRANRSMQYLKGVQFRMQMKPRQVDTVEVYLKHPYFYWIIPETDSVVRVGVISKNPYQDLIRFVKEKKFKGKILEKFAGIVPLASFTPISLDRIFLVGDSAFQMKPLTYGGIYMGMRGAEILTECIVKGEFDEYTTRWFKRFGKEIRMALRTREFAARLSERDLKRLFSFIKKHVTLIEDKADFENHSLLIWEFLKNKQTASVLLPIVLRILGGSLRFSSPEYAHATE